MHKDTTKYLKHSGKYSDTQNQSDTVYLTIQGSSVSTLDRPVFLSTISLLGEGGLPAAAIIKTKHLPQIPRKIRNKGGNEKL